MTGSQVPVLISSTSARVVFDATVVNLSLERTRCVLHLLVPLTLPSCWYNNATAPWVLTANPGFVALDAVKRSPVQLRPPSSDLRTRKVYGEAAVASPSHHAI